MTGTPNSEIPNGGVKVKLNSGECWNHVLENHLSVYDMTYWTRMDTHPGNEAAASLGNPNPIKKWLRKLYHIGKYLQNEFTAHN